MSEPTEGKLSSKFYRLAAFALVMTSVVIFFGTIYIGMHYMHEAQAQHFDANKMGMIAAVSGDFALKGILTSIFAMLFAVVFMLNDLLRVLDAKKL